MIYLQLFWVYLKIGLFGFGGGYAMLSLIQEEVVQIHNWLTNQEFTDIVAISQMTPGPIGINSATYIGFKVTGSVLGAATATIAVCLPSLILVLLISYSFRRFRNNCVINACFRGIRPATVGLIASAALLLAFHPIELANLSNADITNIVVTENFPDRGSWLIFGGAFIVTVKKWIHPILTILFAALIGYMFL